MSITSLFDVFSRRPKPDKPPVPARLTDGFRNRVFMLCRDTFGKLGRQDEFWSQAHTKLTYLHGRPHLTDGARKRNAVEDILHFLPDCPDQHFLDFIEYLFHVEAALLVNRNELVRSINKFLEVDDLPYAVTDELWERSTEDTPHGAGQEVHRLVAYPMVIRRDSTVAHSEVVAPALALLTSRAYSSANKEFLDALRDYRHGDYGDCLAKCGSAFESTLKIICDRKRWPYHQTDTAAPLLRTVMERSSIEGFLEQPFLIVATLRNRLSKAHGSGTLQRSISLAKAQYAINATAAAILFFVQETDA